MTYANSAHVVSSCRTFALLLFALGTVQAAKGQGAPTLDSVLRVWREREVATHSVHVEFSGDHIEGKGSSLAGPPEGMTNKEGRVVIIDGVKMRYERTFVAWADAIGSPEPFTVISVFDGRQSKTLSQSRETSDRLHPMGWIANSSGHSDRLNVHISPIVRHFRPVSPVFGVINVAQLKLVRSEDVVDGSRCILLEESEPGNANVRRYWVSPEQDMAIIRYVGASGGLVSYQADVSFKRGAAGWVPERWIAIHLAGNGDVVNSSTAGVTKMSINAPVPASTFDVAFPPGTEVFDRAAKKRFLIKPDGSRREVLQIESDRGATYTELRGKSVGLAGIRSKGRITAWVMPVAALCAIVGGLLALSVRRVFRSYA